jgi:manganese/zinc/iron transport system permease protein
MDAIWIITQGILVALPCAWLGCFLLLRKMTMLGDAISHAVLPGLVIAYLISNSRSAPVILIGAGFLGILVTFMIQSLQKNTKMSADASIGVSFTFLFAIGIILISAFADKIDLDQDCVLYGEIAHVGLDLMWQGIPIMIWQSGIWVLILFFLLLRSYKALWITTFDENYAQVIGLSVFFWHYFLLASVSFTVVLSFEAVGAILVVAFLVVPPAAAHLVSKRLPFMLFFASLIGILAVFSGYGMAIYLDVSIAGAIVSFLGIYFALILITQKLLIAK